MGRAQAIDEARKLKQALLSCGVPEVSIELRQGRPASGDMWNNQFVVADMAHHTVSRYSRSNLTPCLSLVKNGRSDLAGPLCNGYGGWDLCARIITLGYANHSGFGGPITVPSGGKKPPNYTIPKDNARRYAFGWEFEGGLSEADWNRVLTNPRGKGKSMTFREFMARCLNGTQAMYNLPLGAHLEHKTWAPTRKIDRMGYTLARAMAEMKKVRPEGQRP
jgi:hypothetical protein